MTAATTAIFMIVMIVIVRTFTMSVITIRIVLMLGVAALPAAENYKEKAREQDKGEDDERFHC